MIDLRNIENLAKSLSRALPDDARLLREELKTNIEAMMTSALTRMNLVSREEFDVQAALLQRTRMKLDELTRRLAELEAEQRDGSANE